MAMNLERKKEDPEIPTASMADIAFLLIVFFMLTTVFSANKGMEHLLPPDDEQDSVEPDEAIYIQVFPGSQFEMDKTSYTMEQVERVYDYVNGKVQVNAKKPIIIHTNPEANYGDMVKILNQLKLLSANLEQDLAITIPSKDEAERYADYNQ